MRAFLRLYGIELKLLLREPIAVFFTLAFPLLLLFVFGNVFGNEPRPEAGGLGAMDYAVPGYIGMIIGTTAFIGLPIHIAAYREQGVLRRFQATPLHPLLVLTAALLTELAATVLGVILLVTAGRVCFDLQLPVAPLALAGAMLLGTISMYSMGFLLAALAPTARTANAVGMAVFFPMMFLSGAALPRMTMPANMQRLGEYVPLTHVVEMIRKLWFDAAWDTTALAVSAATLIAGAVLSSRRFRWQ